MPVQVPIFVNAPLAPHREIGVGAGSAGCVLANRLTEDGRYSVLVLEAGPMDRNLLIHVPAGVYSVFRDPKLNWNYETEAEPELSDRHIPVPRGRVVGGSSSINSMVYMRGHPLDYDRWAEDFDLSKWSYAQCLPYFKAGETSDRGASDWRGGEGPLGVSRGRYDNLLFDAFVDAGEQAGQGRSDDLNGFQPEGVSRLDATKKNGRRCSAAVAHLHPALKRRNLTLEVHADVREIVLDGNRARGIRYRVHGEEKTVDARREVILAGGAINSPKLLMLSGIGPADDLREIGLTVQHHLPGVGQNLQDHPAVVLTYQCREPVSIDWVENPIAKLAVGARWMVDRGGIAASNIWEAGGLIRGNDRVPYPNLQYHFGPFGVEYSADSLRLSQAFCLQIDQLRPTSRGVLRLNPSDPRGKPSIRLNFFSTEHDRRELVEGVRRARDLVAQPAFDRYRGEDQGAISGAETDGEIEAAIREMAETDYHPCSTCRMGTDVMAVVDEEMRVHGVEALRIVDASVMPRITSANLNAPVQMIAARAADFILGRAQKPAFHARFHFQSDGAASLR
ncbi:MAG: choline dehydrogenase [Pseudomonadota bacterium]